MRLVDNSLKDKIDFTYSKTDPEKKLLKVLSNKTIEKLNEEYNEGILVYPHSFDYCKDKLQELKILEYNEYEEIKNDKHYSLQTFNLIGFIGDGKAQIEINSRFSNIVEGDKNTKSKENVQDYFLYYMLSKVFAVNIVNMEVGGGCLKEIDLLIFIFPRLLKEALRQGLFKQYVKKEYNDANVRGVININKHIRFNYPANGRIAYSTKEFSYDNNITQLIRHTIEYLHTLPMGRELLNSDKDVEQCVRLITQSTPSYQKGNRRSIITENNRPLTHPYYTNYRALQSLCLAILKKERISHGSQNNKVHGILIDASWLWEEYIATIIKETGFVHHTTSNSFKLFKDVENGNKFQNIIPDYIWTLNNGKEIVADAKYIPLNRFDNTDAERASAIYYKTIMYMYRFATNKGYLLYPYSEEENENEKNDVIDYEIDNEKGCHLYKIRLTIPKCEGEYSDFKTNIATNEQEFIKKLQNPIN